MGQPAYDVLAAACELDARLVLMGSHGKGALARLLTGTTAGAMVQFVSVVVLLRSPNDPIPLIAEGRWRGTILRAPRGGQGFGYDPLFYVPDLRCSAAELASDRKNRISHRGQAMQLLLRQLGGA